MEKSGEAFMWWKLHQVAVVEDPLDGASKEYPPRLLEALRRWQETGERPSVKKCLTCKQVLVQYGPRRQYRHHTKEDEKACKALGKILDGPSL